MHKPEHVIRATLERFSVESLATDCFWLICFCEQVLMFLYFITQVQEIGVRTIVWLNSVFLDAK